MASPALGARAAAFLGAAIALAGCAQAASPNARPATSTPPTATSAPPAGGPSPGASPAPLAEPGPLHLGQQVLAQDLEAPWALDFARDGSIWFTERSGRVRVIRGGSLLATPALTLSVVGQAGCEAGLLGIAIKETYAYLYYTYRGSAGNTNRVSRFTIRGDRLSGEQVLLDGIPGGSCYHFGGRIKFGADGRLYVTTGEGFVAARAADPNNLSGKILRMRDDGSGREVFAWGFRNPQGLTFDSQGRLYASSNGPTGDLGLCCHDEVDLVRQGGFYGWPEWAANTRTSYPPGGLPAQRAPLLAESGNEVWAPSGIAFYAPSASERQTLIVAELRGQALRRFILDPADPALVQSQEMVLQGVGRLRDAVAGPDRCLYVLTSNRDGRGIPRAGDDKMLRLCPH